MGRIARREFYSGLRLPDYYWAPVLAANGIMFILKRLFICVCLAASFVLSGCALRPAAMNAAQTDQFVAQLQGDLAAGTLPVARPLDLYDAIARALVANQDLKAAQLAKMLGDSEVALATAEMLPQFVGTSSVYARNKPMASTSQSLAAPQRLNGYSTSSGQVSRSSDLSLSWNILDFGVSYFRARQAGHRSMIAAEQLRRTANQIVEETRVAFWRAAALQKLDAGLAALTTEMATTISLAAQLSASGMTDPLEALTTERDLLSIRRELDQQRKQLLGAEEHLRALIGYPADTPLQLVAGSHKDIPAVGRMSFGEVAGFVLSQRPELRQMAYEQMITAEEARIAFLELFPNLSLVLGASLDQNPFLLHNNWSSLASRASWQFIKILQYPAKSALLDGKSELDRQRTRALAVAVILQAEVALARLQHAQGEYRTLGKLASVQRQLSGQLANLRQVGRAGTQAVTRERMNTLLAEARRDTAYGELQGAYATVLTSFGHDTLDLESVAGQSVDHLAARIRAAETAAFGRSLAVRDQKLAQAQPGGAR